MNTTLELKEKIYNYMELADDKVLEAISTLLETCVGQTYTLTDEQLAQVEERRTRYLTGESKTHNWNDAKNWIGKK